MTAAAGPWHPDGLQAAVYRLSFDTGAYFWATVQSGFYPKVEIVFEVTEPERHHHVSLVLSPFAYSTYRGR
jgi:5-hydroxyisourate hydrolase